MSLISTVRTLISLINFIQRGKIKISSVIEEQINSGEEREIFTIEISKTKLNLDSDGNLSIISPTSVSIKSRLLFLVAKEDYLSDDASINEVIEKDRENELEEFFLSV